MIQKKIFLLSSYLVPATIFLFSFTFYKYYSTHTDIFVSYFFMCQYVSMKNINTQQINEFGYFFLIIDSGSLNMIHVQILIIFLFFSFLSSVYDKITTTKNIEDKLVHRPRRIHCTHDIIRITGNYKRTILE